MHTNNAIDYIELYVTDMEQTKRFYTEAFNWKFTDYSPTYAGIQGNGKEMGGITTDGTVRQGSTLPVIYTDDLEESMAAVRQAGGTITKEPFSFPGGRRFHFSDPSGNILAVWTKA